MIFRPFTFILFCLDAFTKQKIANISAMIYCVLGLCESLCIILDFMSVKSKNDKNLITFLRFMVLLPIFYFVYISTKLESFSYCYSIIGLFEIGVSISENTYFFLGNTIVNRIIVLIYHFILSMCSIPLLFVCLISFKDTFLKRNDLPIALCYLVSSILFNCASIIQNLRKEHVEEENVPKFFYVIQTFLFCACCVTFFYVGYDDQKLVNDS